MSSAVERAVGPGGGVEEERRSPEVDQGRENESQPPNETIKIAEAEVPTMIEDHPESAQSGATRLRYHDMKVAMLEARNEKRKIRSEKLKPLLDTLPLYPGKENERSPTSLRPTKEDAALRPLASIPPELPKARSPWWPRPTHPVSQSRTSLDDDVGEALPTSPSASGDGEVEVVRPGRRQCAIVYRSDRLRNDSSYRFLDYAPSHSYTPLRLNSRSRFRSRSRSRSRSPSPSRARTDSWSRRPAIDEPKPELQTNVEEPRKVVTTTALKGIPRSQREKFPEGLAPIRHRRYEQQTRETKEKNYNQSIGDRIAKLHARNIDRGLHPVTVKSANDFATQSNPKSRWLRPPPLFEPPAPRRLPPEQPDDDGGNQSFSFTYAVPSTQILDHTVTTGEGERNIVEIADTSTEDAARPESDDGLENQNETGKSFHVTFWT